MAIVCRDVPCGRVLRLRLCSAQGRQVLGNQHTLRAEGLHDAADLRNRLIVPEAGDARAPESYEQGDLRPALEQAQGTGERRDARSRKSLAEAGGLTDIDL